ncbi:MAG: hypothetical protein NT032_06520 [Actinobacteria bacterium]|nr:hypothetical protein [Actinomycetota bacterium]
MKSKIAVVALSAACLGYLAISSVRAQQISETSSPLAFAFSISILVVVSISALLIIREILFGLHISQMSSVLEAEQELLPDDLPHTTSGQTEKEAADMRFTTVSKEVENNPDSWRAWFRVALAYDESRDRKRAREAMRKAEKLFRSAF